MLWVREAPYSDRHEAGERLARLLAEEERLCGGISRSGLVVLAAPRGGVAVAVPVADALGAPLDIILARKLPAPGNPELGIGALGEGDVRIVDRELVELFGLREEEIEEIAREVEVEVARRAERYRQRWPAVPLEGACALIIDDGVATGSTLEAAIESARAKGGEMGGGGRACQFGRGRETYRQGRGSLHLPPGRSGLHWGRGILREFSPDLRR